MTPPPAQPTTLLRHAKGRDVHYDWLIARPGQDRLWTARVQPPSSDWSTLGSFDLTVLPPHRRLYLTYEGPLPDRRGHVVGIDAGTVTILNWQADSALLDVAMRHFVGQIELKNLDKAIAMAKVVQPAVGHGSHSRA